MDNLIFTSHKQSTVNFQKAKIIAYEPTTKILLVVPNTNPPTLHFLKHSPEQGTFQEQAQTSEIFELQDRNIIFLAFLVEHNVALVICEQGDILTVDQQGEVDIKASNQEGIAGCTVSPTQQYIYIVTKNKTIIQLDMEFDLIKEVPLDDSESEECESIKPTFSWKADGSFFAINFQTNKGRKCHTRDHMLGIFRSPSKSDPNEDGLVQSVSEKSRSQMNSIVAWQPAAGIIAGSDFIVKDGNKINRVIFWEKNGLRHLQFELQDKIAEVQNLTWSPNSQILLVECSLSTKQRLLQFYHRSNYHWYLKSEHPIDPHTQYSLIKHKNNTLILMNSNKIDVYEWQLRSSAASWRSARMQEKCPLTPHYVVDGQQLKITDMSIAVIPPPMSMSEECFGSNIRGTCMKDNTVLVVTHLHVFLYDYERKKIDKWDIGVLKGIVMADMHLLSCQPLLFNIDNKTYTEQNNTIIHHSSYRQPQPPTYTFLTSDNESHNLHPSYKSQTLTINHQLISEHCTSYTFYHQFLIFTCSSTKMYDGMYIVNLELDSWVVDPSQKNLPTKVFLDEWQEKKSLQFRSVERGSRILTCTHNRVVFVLPRGNLETIYPKVFMINHVHKAMNEGNYRIAFETIRTHKLDLNLLYDLSPERFSQHTDTILTTIGKVDYLNLFISQLKNTISTELQYCLSKSQLEEVQTFYRVRLENKKVEEVCRMVSKTLRQVDWHRYVLVIFTAEIRMGLLSSVLKQIKNLKQQDGQVPVPPHLTQKPKQKHKEYNPEEILQYICWLVDANVIYQESLLTYDLDLASLTARYTQMNPKQYIPYIESLKEINDPIQMKKKICLDLKRYEQAVIELSQGQNQHIQCSFDLIAKHRLFKVGLRVFRNSYDHAKKVKTIIGEYLQSINEPNQAYQMYRSIGIHDRAINIAKSLFDGQKILDSVDAMLLNHDEKQKYIQQFLNETTDQTKNKNELAILKLYVGRTKEAVSLYLKAGNYQKAYSLFHKVQYEWAIQEFNNTLALLASLHKNQLLKDKTALLEKQARLQKVHQHKKLQGESHTHQNRDNDDMYSEVSVSSKTNSSYTISTTTGMKKKKDKKKNILARNVKEGSLLEEEYLLAFINDLQSRLDSNIRESKILIQHLLYLNMIEQAEQLRNITREYIDTLHSDKPKSFIKLKFEEQHHEAIELYTPQHKQKQKIDSFNYLF